MRKLTINGAKLLDRIDPNHAFVTELGSVGCITWPQREHIVNIVQPRDRNDKLLEFLTRRSVADFEKFIKVLSKEQAHLVPLLLTDGGKIQAEILCYIITKSLLRESLHENDFRKLQIVIVATSIYLSSVI